MDFITLFNALSIVIASLAADSVCNAAGERSVYFSLMVSSAPSQNTTPSVRAVNQALETVNGDSDILPGFRLQYSTVLDTQCNATRAVQLFNQAVASNDSIVAVLGCGCSSATLAVASASNGIIPVVSFDSTSVSLSDRSSFPNVFRTVPSDESLAPALASLMKYYGWRKVAIISQREQQFVDLLPLLNESLSQITDISLTYLYVHERTEAQDQENMFESSSRIFFLNTSPRLATQCLCKAFQAGRRYPEYVWVTPGWYQQGWWSDDEEYLHSLNCSLNNIQQQLDRSLALLAHPDVDYQNVIESFNTSSYAMDGLVTLALALNETLVKAPHLNLSLQDAIKSTEFTGATGEVRLDALGNRQRSIVFLKQHRLDSNGLNLSPHIVVRITADGNFTFINGENNSTLWPDSDITGIPPITDMLNTLKIPVYGYVLFLVDVGVILSLVCLLFNIVFRNRKVVKLTSPNLNYVIILGAILLMVGNVFVPSPSQNLPMLAIFCTISRIFLSVGYDICFVVALVKTIRVAYIFWNVSPVKKKVQDWQLLLLAAGIIMIEIIYTIPLLSVIYVNGDTSIVLNENRPPFTNEQGYTVVNSMIACGNSSIHYIIYVALSVIFKLIIHVTGLILAFLTRKVKIDPLNDSRYSAILIYFSAAFLITAIVIFFLVEDNNIYAVVWTTFVLLEVCVFLGFTFVPKMVSLYKDPEGERIFSGDADTQTKSQYTTSMTMDNAAAAGKDNTLSAVAAESRA